MINIKIPVEWKILEPAKTQIPSTSGELILISQKKVEYPDRDNFQEYVFVRRHELDTSVSLDTYFDFVVTEDSSKVPYYKINESDTITINGFDSKWWLSEVKGGFGCILTKQFIVVDAREGFLITFGTTCDSIKFYEPIFDSVAYSFKVSK